MSNVHGSKWIRPEKRAAIYHRDGMRCVYCGSDETLGLDHLLPRELGGSHHESNLVTCCGCCNSSRQDKPLRKWLNVLRKHGIRTDGIAARIRRLTATPLNIAMGKRMIANRRAARKGV